MKKYVVYGQIVVNVTKEVWADSKDEAFERAESELSCLTAYCGNGGWDKLVGVDGEHESVDLYDDIEWNDADCIGDDPDHHECPECRGELEEDGDGIWYCDECNMWFDADGVEVDPDDLFDDDGDDDEDEEEEDS